MDPGEQGETSFDPPPGEGYPGHDDSSSQATFCARCNGAFRASELVGFDGDLVCELCLEKLEKRKSKPSDSNVFLGGEQAMGDERPSRPASGPLMSQAPPETMTPLKFTLVVIIGVLLVGFAGAAVFIFVLDKESGSAVPPPEEGSEPEPEPRPMKVEKPKPKPVPKEPEPPRSYEPRWFVGTYLGISTEEGEGMGAMIFEEGDEKVLIKAPPALQSKHNRGQRYRFRFKPTDRFYDSGVVSWYDLWDNPTPQK
jgi:hypothetical protein